MRSRWFRRLAPLAFLLLVLAPRAASATGAPHLTAHASAVATSHDVLAVAAHPERSHVIAPRLASSTPTALPAIVLLLGLVAGPMALRRLASPRFARRGRGPPLSS